jgi:type I restriction enzyme M protein
MTPEEFEAWLWEAANILRGPVEPANMRDYVFPLLFLKRISDTWDEEQASAESQFGKDVSEAVAADFHTFQIPKGCHWADLRKVNARGENVGLELQNLLQKVEAANPTRLAQIFGNTSWADRDKIPEERLIRLIDHFGRHDLRPSKMSDDLMGGGYEYLLKRFSDESGTSAGQFYTPRSVVRLLTLILDPQPKETVYDPTCGSAGMLIYAANTVKEHGGSVAQMRFYGQEVNQTSTAIGRMNLFIHQVEDAKILREDTLNKPMFVDSRGKLDQFDVVLANPPFSLKDWGADNWASDPHKRAIGGVPPRGNGDFAWVQHMIASMKPGTGRVGVVMPHGVLFRGGQEAKIRQYLIESDLLETVIGLAPNLFYGTSIPASLLIFRADKFPQNKKHVLFIDASKRFTKASNKNILQNQDVADIHSMYLADGDEEHDNITSRLVTHKEIEENNWDLNIGRYLKTEDADIIDVTSAIEDLNRALDELTTAQKAMFERLKAAGYA